MKFLLSFLSVRKLCALLVTVLRVIENTFTAASWYVLAVRSCLSAALDTATLNRRTTHHE